MSAHDVGMLTVYIVVLVCGVVLAAAGATRLVLALCRRRKEKR